MSSYASLFAFERDFGVRSFMMRDQIDMLSNFLSKTGIVKNMKVLQAYLTHWRQYAWEEVFRYNFVFEVEQNIKNISVFVLQCVCWIRANLFVHTYVTFVM